MMNDLEYLLYLVKIQKKISADILKEYKYPSGVYIQAKGSYSAYNTVEAYLESMQNKNLREEIAENGCKGCLQNGEDV